MKNLLKLTSLAGLCFGMIVLGACGGGSGGAGGAYTVTVNGTAYSASGTASGNVGLNYTVTNGLTYVATGTDTNWQVCTTCSVASSSTGTSVSTVTGTASH